MNVKQKTKALADECKELVGFVDFVQTPAYAKKVAVLFRAWLAEAEAVFDKATSTPEQLKDAQIKRIYVNQLQKMILTGVERYGTAKAELKELTGED